jgi:hypothetical protein
MHVGDQDHCPELDTHVEGSLAARIKQAWREAAELRGREEEPVWMERGWRLLEGGGVEINLATIWQDDPEWQKLFAEHGLDIRHNLLTMVIRGSQEISREEIVWLIADIQAHPEKYVLKIFYTRFSDECGYPNQYGRGGGMPCGAYV